MSLSTWAIKWGVSREAIIDLRNELGVINTEPSPQAGESESAIQTRIRLEASRKGSRLWRNNVGAALDTRGNFIRYGLANETKQMNAKIKSSDLIGIHPVRITQAHVGQLIGQFMSVEVKAGTWKYSGTVREKAQLKWLELIVSLGGMGRFINREGDL